MTDTLLGIYLNDHLAGAVVGGKLAKRLARAERYELYGPVLHRIAGEIDEDRSDLLKMMNALDIPVRRYKTVLAKAGERIGALKPNGRLLTRSPLSRVVELEALRLDAEGKAAGWRTLKALADSRLDAARLDELIDRATTQIEDLERLRVQAASEAFDGKAESVVARDDA
ncbi:hypothetical protein LWC34_49760 [Kibdelosporangium philippinense]|uniref:Uncharacterized protein n=1 Tax=Kibdelosporangium philippinense TaxID=211113 RepID=A0ABS8ZTC2_9PSEU|nr:hypothetical protein [Kibdelosporangium philippinense]MCE7010839.1 hypothetical protein [Kibdelosporangium philippinense]